MQAGQLPRIRVHLKHRTSNTAQSKLSLKRHCSGTMQSTSHGTTHIRDTCQIIKAKLETCSGLYAMDHNAIRLLFVLQGVIL